MSQMLRKYYEPYMGLPREVYVIFFSRMINAMGVFVLPLIVILMENELHMTPKATGGVMMVGGSLYGIGSLIGGKTADQFGRKKIIVLFSALAALSYIICAFQPVTKNTLIFIVAAMFFYGVADPAQNALIADLTNPENRERTYSFTYLGSNIGFALGPTLGGLLLSKKLFFFFFAGDALTAFVATILIVFFIPETIKKIGTNDNMPEMEKSVQGGILKVLFERPVLIVFSVVMLGYAFVYQQWSYLIPLHASKLYGDSGAAMYGFLASFNGLIVIFFTPLLTNRFEGIRNTKRILVGGFFYLVGFGVLGLIETKLVFFGAVFFLTLGEIMVYTSMGPFITNNTPSSHRGRMNAVLPIIIGAGYTVSPYVIGNILSHSTIKHAWHLISFIMMACIVSMYLMDQNEKHKILVVKSSTDINEYI